MSNFHDHGMMLGANFSPQAKITSRTLSQAILSTKPLTAEREAAVAAMQACNSAELLGDTSTGLSDSFSFGFTSLTTVPLPVS